MANCSSAIGIRRARCRKRSAPRRIAPAERPVSEPARSRAGAPTAGVLQPVDPGYGFDSRLLPRGSRLRPLQNIDDSTRLTCRMLAILRWDVTYKRTVARRKGRASRQLPHVVFALLSGVQLGWRRSVASKSHATRVGALPVTPSPTLPHRGSTVYLCGRSTVWRKEQALLSYERPIIQPIALQMRSQ